MQTVKVVIRKVIGLVFLEICCCLRPLFQCVLISCDVVCVYISDYL
jgi:hypothetical protein